MAHPQGEYYFLGRSANASMRLYLQHWMWQRQLGYLLHPAVQVDKNANLEIMDMACGTGIWLIDLAKEMPNANLHGFDVSTAQFPHKNWLPAHVSLQQLDAFGDIPPVLIEKYDVVHIGLIVAAIRGGDPSPLVDKLLSVLKPGGYLQWNEADVEILPQVAAAADVPRSNVETLYKRIREAVEARSGLDVKWVRRLSSVIKAHPDVETIIADEVCPVPDELATPASLAHLLSLGEIIDKLPQDVVKELDLTGLYQRAAIEMQAGMSVRMGQVVVVARKRPRFSDSGASAF